ncbi:hypothetical protein IQ267_13650 [filamentous cyanobacterium LEGE 07170]|nr:hypothetical protein [filamentous cyanobacterium LEGE 07170]
MLVVKAKVAANQPMGSMLLRVQAIFVILEGAIIARSLFTIFTALHLLRAISR